MSSEHRVHHIPLAQHPPPPVVDERDDEGQQAQAVIRRQDGQAKQIPKADQNEEMLQTAALSRQCAYLIVDRQTIEDFSEGIPQRI